MKRYDESLKVIIFEGQEVKIIHKIIKRGPLYKKIFEETSFLHTSAGIVERYWYIAFDEYEIPTCINCKKEKVKFVKRSEKHLVEKMNAFCSRKCYTSYVDPVTGDSINSLRNKKTKETLSRIDPITGMSGYKKNGIKIKETNSKIDTKTGLNNYKSIGQKAKETKSKIDSKTGKSKYDLLAIKTAATRNNIDPETGLTYYKLSGKKISERLNKFNPNTGLTIAKERGIKCSKTLNKIDPNTGLTIAKERGIKCSKKRSEINPKTGLTIAEESGIKQSRNKRRKFFKIIEKELIFGTEYEILSDQWQYVSNGTISFKHIKCSDIINVDINGNQFIMPKCRKCYPKKISGGETDLYNYIIQIVDYDIKRNDRNIISPYEIDVYIKDKLAIEYNGVYWHSYNNKETDKQFKNRHLDKTKMCEDVGIPLFHIFDNEWIQEIKKNIWKSVIANKLGKSKKIYARKCTIQIVTSTDAAKFLEFNHLQGSVNSRIQYGLYYGDQLVSLMTFGKSRYNKKYEWELLRYCNLVNHAVIGGASKLFKDFLKNHSGSIISYANRRWSNGNLYKKLGFEFVGNLSPNYYYTKDCMLLEPRQKYQKHKLKDVLENFDDNLTEKENMFNNGYRIIYDSGNMSFVYNR